MCHRNRLVAGLLTLILIAGCSSDNGASDEPTGTAAATTTTEAATTTAAPTTTEAPTTTAAPTTTEPASTTTTAAPVAEVDDETAAAFVAGVRDAWDRTERTVGGTAPEMTDEEILAIGMGICDHIAAGPAAEGQPDSVKMEMYSAVAAHVSEAMGIPYDPALQDAGFDSEIDARNVIAFKIVIDGDGLCPNGWGFNIYMFSSPWSAKASAEDA